MGKPIKWGSESVLLEIDLGVFGLGIDSAESVASGLVISTKCDIEELATVYESELNQIEDIAEIGVYVAPAAGKCRFKETDIPGIYALYLPDERFAVTESPVGNARTLLIHFSGPDFPEMGVTYEIDLLGYDPYDEPVTLTALADAALLRDWESITDTVPARCLLNAVRFLRNKWSLSGSTLTVYEEDGTTVAFTMTVNSDSGAEPIIGSTPD